MAVKSERFWWFSVVSFSNREFFVFFNLSKACTSSCRRQFFSRVRQVTDLNVLPGREFFSSLYEIVCSARWLPLPIHYLPAGWTWLLLLPSLSKRYDWSDAPFLPHTNSWVFRICDNLWWSCHAPSVEPTITPRSADAVALQSTLSALLFVVCLTSGRLYTIHRPDVKQTTR